MDWILYPIELQNKVTVDLNQNEALFKTINDPSNKAVFSKRYLQPLSDHTNPNHLADLGLLRQL